jgi:phosphoribosylamine--glycine ligase
MKVLIIGSGGREHVLTWKIKQSPLVSKIYCSPGNGGMSEIAECVDIAVNDIPGLLTFAKEQKIDLTVVGPEAPLTQGMVDVFEQAQLKIFGPKRKAAQLESSKVFAKEFMYENNIPTAPFIIFNNYAEAKDFVEQADFPLVIKADGLAAGKGVIVAHDTDEAQGAIDEIMVQKKFGNSGDQVVIESCLFGQEVSIMALTDGKTMAPLLPSQDHKQAFDGDKGPNTGGMGAYCPTRFVTPEIMKQIIESILEPTIAGLRNDDINYQGVVYAGLMLTDSGPRVLEYNCRFGDPETQAVLPLLNADIVELMAATVDKRLGNIGKIEWRKGVATCVVMASKGYPGKYKTGRQISGLRKSFGNGYHVFHAGTKREGGNWSTSGGRVLDVVAVDSNLKSALNRTYGLVKKIKFEGASYRRDIGFRALSATEQVNGS